MAKSGKRSLKATLVSQQVRLKKNEQVKNAAQVKDMKKGVKGPGINKTLDKGRGKAEETSTAIPKRVVIPFNSTHKILLLGEGNFSFTLALLKLDPHRYVSILNRIPAQNITATAYDSEEECYSKYPEARGIVEEIKTQGATVLFNVDAGNLEGCKKLKGQRWDKVVWNFPHAGKGIADQDRNILTNQKLLLAFLRSIAPFLTQGPVPVFNIRKKKSADDEEDEEDDDKENIVENGVEEDDDDQDITIPQNQKSSSRGTVLITLRNVHPYTEWNLPHLAKHPPPPPNTYTPSNPQYIQLRSFAFYRAMWEGYEHRMTKGERMGGMGTTGVGGEDRMWEFCLRD